MQQDHLTEIEELAYYRKYYKSRKTMTVIFSILFFTLGFLVAKFIYNDATIIMHWKQ